MDSLHEQLQMALGQAYRVDRELGGGGMSRVFLCTETALDRQVVLKVLPPELASAVSVERFKREIALAARLQHAHIVPLLSAGDANGLPWFSMPFVDGESLRTRLGHGELPVADVVRTLRDVASALAHAHGRGVVHRDIKPENILLAQGGAVVTDFGVAKALLDAGDAHGTTLTSVGVALGTPAYMAPEQIGGDPHTDHRADIYALGVVAHEMLTGRNPFGGRSIQATAAAHMTEEPTPTDRIRTATPPALAQLVSRCLAKSAADRPQTALEIVHALDGLVTPLGTMPLHVGSGGAYPAFRRSRVGTAAIAIGVVVVLAGAWLVSQRSRDSKLNPRRVAVAPCENLTGDTTLAPVGRIAADYLTQQIVQTDSVDVVSGSTVAMLARDAKGQGDIVQRLAAMTHAGSVITCTVTKFGDSLRVEARIIDAGTGTIKRALEPGVGPVSDPIAAVSALRERLLGSLVSGDLARRVVTAGQPPKYSAYLLLMDAGERFGRYQDFRGARPLLERAIALDSGLMWAYSMLATTYSNLGEWDDAERIVSILAQRRDRLSAYDRLGLDFLTALLRGDQAAMSRAMRGQVERDSNPVSLYIFATVSNGLLRPADALPALNASDSAQTAGGWSPQVTVGAITHHLRGDHRSELARLEKGRKTFPNERAIRARELNAFAGLHEPASALALADTILREAVDPNETVGISAVYFGAQEFGAHGDSATARQLTRLAVDWVSAHPTPKPTNLRHELEAGVWFLNGQLDSARTHLLAAAGDTAAIANGGWLGIIAALQGNRDRATIIADSIGSLNRKWSRGSEQYWRAAILATLGHKDEAVALLKDAAARGQGMSSWHYVASLSALRGYAPFEAMIVPQK